jgi:hypothetical protein
VWTLPAIAKASDPTKTEPLLTVWAAGWYSDGSIAVLGMLRGGEWRLYRVREMHTRCPREHRTLRSRSRASDRDREARPGAVLRAAKRSATADRDGR